MRKRTGMWLVVLAVCSCFALAQQPSQSPNLPPSVVGPQLVAWTYLQKPQPTPQPLPPPERTDQPQPGNSQTEPPAQAQPSLQAFVGTIVKEGSRYVLKVSESIAYQVDDQVKAKAYEGKQVRVSGSLDAKNNLLHIGSIELLS